MNQYFVAIKSSRYPEVDAVWFYQRWSSAISLKNALNKLLDNEGLYVARVVKTSKDCHHAYSDSEYLRNALSMIHYSIEEAKKERRREWKRKHLKKLFSLFTHRESACC